MNNVLFSANLNGAPVRFRVAMVSLGCAKNLVDSEVMMGYLRDAGYQLVYEPADAEIIVVNTCGFIESAKQEAIDKLLECAEYKQQGYLRWLVAAGCLAQRYSEDLLEALPEVDAFLGNSDFPAIISVLERLERGESGFTVVHAPEQYLQTSAMPRLQATLPATAYLKLSDGCDNRCSYCAIPLIRGGHRSRQMEDVITEATRLVEGGVLELCLIAQDTTHYGYDNYGKPMLATLCKALLAALPTLRWLRILYCHPAHLEEDILLLMQSEPRFCSYLDIPLQHSETRVLQSMSRPGSREDIEALLQHARTIVPDIMVRTTFLVGFPGETEAEFTALQGFVEDMCFDHMGAFAYSAEEDTVAASMAGQLDEVTKVARRDALMQVQQLIAAEQMQRWIAKEVEVLIENIYADGLRIGRFQGQAPDVDGLVLLHGSSAPVGAFVHARITAVAGYDLVAEPLE